ncbi:hypothetical protein GCM10010294_54680 [Streptomyces griseoloalbus]|nr:hypothetical protein GCM10010294_54680 [Streptomyces griseoloalbus]
MSGADVSPRVRRRTDRDLGDCVRVLAEVHEHDGYPVNWPDAWGSRTCAAVPSGWVGGTGRRTSRVMASEHHDPLSWQALEHARIAVSGARRD